MNCTPESPKDYPIRPVSLTEIRFEDDFWLPRIETSHRVTIPYAFRRLFLLTGDSQYIDVLERTLYNALLSGVSMEWGVN
jgi:hypothetical protein